LLLACFGWSQAQTYNVTVQGTLINSVTGAPYANHHVYITYDSTATFSYYTTVQTDAMGNYQDIVAVPGIHPGGTIDVHTYDCYGYFAIGSYAYSSSNNVHSSLDSICGPNPNAICVAAFTPVGTGNGNFQFNDYSSSGDPAAWVVDWQWDFGDGTTSTMHVPTHQYSNPGQYAVCLTITTSTGCVNTHCDTVAVSFSGTNCNASWALAGQTGSTFNFVSTSTAAAGILAYHWDFGDGGTSTLANPSHTYALLGNYGVTLTIIANDSCVSTAYNTVLNNGSGSCQAALQASQAFDPLKWYFWSSSYIPSNTYVTAMNWDFGDGTTSTAFNSVEHIFPAAGFYIVCLDIATNTGCTSTACDTIRVGNGFCATGFYPEQVQGCDYIFHDSSWASTGIASYFWDFGDGTTSTLANPTHTFATSGSHTVCLTTVGNDSCIHSACHTISCGSSSACNALYTWAPDSSGQYTLLLYNLSSGAGLSYYWDFGDGTSSTSAYPSHVYSGAGTYVVCLYVSDGQGCSSMYCDSLQVLYRLGQPFSINVVSPLTTVAPAASQALGLQLSPNPAQEQVRLNLTLGTPGTAQVRLLDLQGRVLQARALGQLPAGLSTETLTLSELPEGIYLVEALVDGQRSVQKLVHTR
jgi:PKD repeat protein